MRVVVFLLGAGTCSVLAFTPSRIAFRPPGIGCFRHDHHQTRPDVPAFSSLTFLAATAEDDEGEEPENPYADPNYPDLEFVNYADPEYTADQGEEFADELSTEEQIEAMREERRRRNDEFQFQTYFAEVLKKGEEYRGEWTVYKTTTFLPDADKVIPPKLMDVTNGEPLRVISRGYKEVVETDSPFPVDAERIRHEERLIAVERGGESDLSGDEITINTYWPEQVSAFDFRGHQGIMVCGNAWTICTAVPLLEKALHETEHRGPFSEYRAELGIQEGQARFRVKLDYSVLPDDGSSTPPLHLKSMTVCRETRSAWPRMATTAAAVEDRVQPAESLFAPPGAAGGLYDPPPVGSDAQAAQYMLLDLEGGATVLLPYLLDQDPTAHGGEGWVTSLDWTPGEIRYQVDRKVHGGDKLLGLRTLELSEVRQADAEQYRPRDGGRDMRQ